MAPPDSLVLRLRHRLASLRIVDLGTWIGWSAKCVMAGFRFLTSPGAFSRLLHLDRPGRVALFRSGMAEVSLRLAELEKGPFYRDPLPRPARRQPDSVQPGNAPRVKAYGVNVNGVNVNGVNVNGVNVFGDWAATTGLAQAARRLTVALSDAGFGLSLATVASGAPRDESRVPHTLGQIPDDRRFAVDLWMLNVNEFDAVSDKLLRPEGSSNYAIGVWYWELTTFPDSLISQMARVDEIWVATTFVQSSFRSVTDRPVLVVPAIVPELRGSGRTRKDFGLSEDEVIFLFSFDVHSMVARKNPGAVVEAFSRAFGSSSSPGARLVIKVLNLDRHPRVAAWLREAVASVDGILVEDDLEANELVDLFMCADAYVSLHRSEGFGFGIAESMALGKPVIATAYSGNTDFATAANSFQVGYHLREITVEDHLFDEGASEMYRIGAVWAEPDVAQAARWMRVVARDPELRRRIGEAGRATILERFSASAVVDIVRSRLASMAGR